LRAKFAGDNIHPRPVVRAVSTASFYRLPGGDGVGRKKQSRGGWLFKEEPSCYSYDQLKKDGTAQWTGVKNALARQYLRAVQVGDRVLYYHTGSQRAIVGEMRIAAGPPVDPDGADPKAVAVTVEPVRRWKRPVTLEEIKKDVFFSSWELVRISRLSVMPVSPEQWERLEEMCRTKGT
jgi:predicted RNA-binding protein with PUA-like domain